MAKRVKIDKNLISFLDKTKGVIFSRKQYDAVCIIMNNQYIIQQTLINHNGKKHVACAIQQVCFKAEKKEDYKFDVKGEWIHFLIRSNKLL